MECIIGYLFRVFWHKGRKDLCSSLGVSHLNKGGGTHVIGGDYMSRSYKKYPIIRQERVDKKVWNRAVRNLKLDYSLRGSQYKKVMINFDTGAYRWTLEEAIKCYIPSNRYPTLESWVEYWKRCCYRK